ncbi:glycosyltransferase family 4 protein [Glutamicibacter sp. X7]
MKLVIDARYVRITHHDGISRFTAGLIAAVSEYADVTMLIHDERQLEHLPRLPYLKINAPTSVLEPLAALRVNKLKPDVVFSPMQTMGSWGRKFPLVLTLHDLIYYAHPKAPGFLPAPIRAGWYLFHQVYWPQRMLLNRADAVATVSHTTRDLMRRHRLTRRKIGIVSNAPNPVDAVRDPQTQPAKTLLYMGSFMAYKNVETLIDGMASLPDYELHLLSPIRPDRQTELEERARPGTRLVFHNGVSDIEYAELLARCTALVTLSREEGYGLPLVEAMSTGTPVVVSDMPIFREVAQDAALYVNSDSAEGFASAVRELADGDRWRELSRRSVANAQRYSWQHSARQLMELCEYAITHSRVHR